MVLKFILKEVIFLGELSDVWHKHFYEFDELGSHETHFAFQAHDDGVNEDWALKDVSTFMFLVLNRLLSSIVD